MELRNDRIEREAAAASRAAGMSETSANAIGRTAVSEDAAQELAEAREYAASGQAARDSAARSASLSPAERAEYDRQTAECRQYLYMVRR